jgi:hypothetical protein
MTCVCGHIESDHRPTVMSVPMKGGHTVIYPIPVNSVSVAQTYPTSTYESVECGCGCGEYLADSRLRR